MLISDLVVDSTRGVRPSASPRHALAMMEVNGRTMLPVIDANGEVVGVITEREVNLLLTSTAAGVDPDLAPVVSEAMTSQPPALGLHDELSRALDILEDVPWDALPITQGRRLVGVLTRDEAMSARTRDGSGGGRPRAAGPLTTTS